MLNLYHSPHYAWEVLVRIKSIQITALALSAAWSVGAEETYRVADLVSRIDSTFEVKESRAAAYGMSLKADTVGGLPDLGVAYEIMDPDDPEMTTHKISIRQELPLWGKRSLRRQAAVVESIAATLMVADRKLEIRLSLLKSLVEYHYALKIKGIRESELDTLRRLVATTKLRYSTGGVALSAVTQAEIERAETERMIIEMDAMAAISRNEAFDMVDIGAMGAVLGHFVPVPKAAPSGLNVESLYEKALAHLPSLALAARELDFKELGLKLARREWFPDLMLDFSYSYQPGAKKPGSVSAGFGLNLPVFSAKAKSAEIAMAASLSEGSAARLAGEKDRLYRSITGLLARGADYGRRIALFQTEILPLRTADFENRLGSYAVDKAELEMVLDSIRMRYDAEIRLLEYKRDYTTTLLELEYLTGENLVAFEDGRTD